MTFDGSVFAWLVLALLPIALPVLLALLARHLFHIEAGLLPLAVLLVIGLATIFGITAYLDSTGVPVKAQVLSKKDSIIYHLDGSWNRQMVANVSYRLSDLGPTVVQSLDLTPARFDEITQGDFISLRCPNKPGLFPVTRLDDQGSLSQIWYWFTNQPFLFFFVLGLLGVLGLRFMLQTNLPMLFFLSSFVTIGAWWMASVGVPVWDQVSTLFGSFNSGIGTVREVHPPYLGSGIQGWFSTTLFKPTDLILIDLIPEGRPQVILTVDEVDLGSAKLKPGQTVTVEYSAANPRHCLVSEATRSFVWKNGFFSSLFTAVALFAVGRVAYTFREKRQRRNGAKPPNSRRTNNNVPA